MTAATVTPMRATYGSVSVSYISVSMSASRTQEVGERQLPPSLRCMPPGPRWREISNKQDRSSSNTTKNKDTSSSSSSIRLGAGRGQLLLRECAMTHAPSRNLALQFPAAQVSGQKVLIPKPRYTLLRPLKPASCTKTSIPRFL